MREILFRGKSVEDGEWIYGAYYHMTEYYGDPWDKHIIIMSNDDLEDNMMRFEEVIPETVGQYTGLKDWNGKKIFEGDIVSTRKNGTRTEKLKGCFGVDSDGYPQKIPGYQGETEYHYTCQIECYAPVEFNPIGGYYLRGTTMYVNAICNEVVGNIHDNPALLEGEKTDD